MSLRGSLTFIFSFVLLCCADVVAEAATIRVPADHSTIQAAINAAASGDTIVVAPGVYTENLDFFGKAIRVTSEQGPQMTIIDGNQMGSVVVFKSGEGPQSVLDGFTVRNGSATGASLRGGGIRIENSSPTISGNVVTGNTAGDGGGGISSSFGSPTIQGNVISNNRQMPGWSGGVGGGGVNVTGASAAQLLNNAIYGNSWSASGGGVSLFAAGNPTLKDNLITNNSAGSQGGGIVLFNRSDAVIVQNVIAGNSASTGGGVYWMVPSGAAGPRLINNTIVANHGPQGSAVFADGFDAQAQLINNLLIAAASQNAVTCGSLDGSSVPMFEANDVFAASGMAWSGNCANQTGMNGNISQDPIFRDASAGDYRLLNGSPAIDAGSANQAPAVDLNGTGRPADGDGDGVSKFDMGAYEAPLVDNVPPVTTTSVTPGPNGAGWHSTNPTVTLTASDTPGSGVQSIRYSLTGAQSSPTVIASNPASVGITAEGSTTVHFSAVDNAGNVESEQSLTLMLDKSLPLISGMPPAGCTLSPPKHQLVQVATVVASDVISGVASFSVTATSSEPDSGVGGGDVAGDIVIVGGSVQLRAERAPSGKGRIYTIVATATDLAGNTTMSTATCSVPK